MESNRFSLVMHYWKVYACVYIYVKTSNIRVVVSIYTSIHLVFIDNPILIKCSGGFKLQPDNQHNNPRAKT